MSRMQIESSSHAVTKANAVLAILLAVGIAVLGPVLRGAGTLDTDGWFLLASGREVMKNGIPHVNPWSLTGGQGVVLQQWLHGVWLYLWYEAGGYAAVSVSVAVPAALAAWSYIGLVQRLSRGSRYSWAGLLVGAVGFLLMDCYISVRPTLWTAAILFLTIHVCITWCDRGDNRILFSLPALSVLSVNLQAALWPLPVAAAACFLLPGHDEIDTGDLQESLRAWARSRLPLVVAVATMAVATLLNPYLLDGSLYLLKSFGAASYGGAIQEMRPALSVPSATAFLAISVLAGALSCIAARSVPPTWLLIFWAASIVAGLSAVRCLWISWMVSFLVVAFSVGCRGDGALERKRMEFAGRAMLCIALAVSVICCGLDSCYRESDGFEVGWESVDRDMSPIVSALKKATPGRIWSEDATVMNYLEWAGVPVTYDMRPEIWSEAIAGKGTADDYRAFVDQRGRGYRGIDSAGWSWALVKSGNARKFEDRNKAYMVARGRGYILYWLR